MDEADATATGTEARAGPVKVARDGGAVRKYQEERCSAADVGIRRRIDSEEPGIENLPG